jgi:hypothetical protein
LRPCQTRIRGDLPYKIFFVHSVREFYQSEIADVNTCREDVRQEPDFPKLIWPPMNSDGRR